MAKKLTTEQIKQRLAKVSPSILVLSRYKGSKLPIKCQCLSCNSLFRMRWNDLSQGHGCVKCNREAAVSERRLTTREVRGRLRQINPDVIVLGTYTNASTPIKCQCRQCGHNWSPKWTNLSRGKGCPRCAGFQQLSIVEAKVRLRDVNTSIEIVKAPNTISCGTVLICRCSKCRTVWSPTWGNLKANIGCPVCANNQKLCVGQIKELLAKVNPNIEILSKEYHNNYTPIRCRCIQCEYDWFPVWSSLQQGHGCPKCSGGKSEEEVRLIFEELTGKKWPRANPSEVPFLHGLHADGYNNELNAIFEFDGDQHKKIVHRFHGCINPEERLQQQRRRDWRKNIQCYRHGVTLIRVPQRVRDKESYIRSKLERLGWLRDAAQPQRTCQWQRQ